jgi:hypothetical protein
VKVKELIEKLRDFDPEMRVIVDGYESGFDDVRHVTTLGIELNANGDGCGIYGAHEKGSDETAVWLHCQEE